MTSWQWLFFSFALSFAARIMPLKVQPKMKTRIGTTLKLCHEDVRRHDMGVRQVMWCHMTSHMTWRRLMTYMLRYDVMMTSENGFWGISQCHIMSTWCHVDVIWHDVRSPVSPCGHRLVQHDFMLMLYVMMFGHPTSPCDDRSVGLSIANSGTTPYLYDMNMTSYMTSETHTKISSRVICDCFISCNDLETLTKIISHVT